MKLSKRRAAHSANRVLLAGAVVALALGMTSCAANPLTNPDFHPAAGAGGSAASAAANAGNVAASAAASALANLPSIGSLPADFPSADVPIASGQILVAHKSDVGGQASWTVAVDLADGVDAATVTKQFTDAGYTASDLTADGRFSSLDGTATDIVGGQGLGFVKPGYKVTVAVGASASGVAEAGYIITLTS